MFCDHRLSRSVPFSVRGWGGSVSRSNGDHTHTQGVQITDCCNNVTIKENLN